jgi:hypothetical protein
MRRLSEQDRNRLWQEVSSEFPDDRVMQEVHFARLVHREMLRDESDESRASFFSKEAARVLGGSTPRVKAASA